MEGIALWLRAAAALAVVALVLAGMRFVLRSAQRAAWSRGRAGVLEVLESAPLGYGAGICLIRAGEQRYVVGVGTAGVRLIAALGPGEREGRKLAERGTKGGYVDPDVGGVPRGDRGRARAPAPDC